MWNFKATKFVNLDYLVDENFKHMALKKETKDFFKAKEELQKAEKKLRKLQLIVNEKQNDLICRQQRMRGI